MEKNNLLNDVKAAVKDIQWVPDWGQARIEGMLDSSPDWCISRQRTWGVPIAIFIHKETQELHPRTPELIEQVAQKVEAEGMEAWFELDAGELLGEDAEHYQKVTDTLDVWFDSGVTHYSVMQQRDELQYPADIYLEGSDQHRGWFQSSLKTAMAMNGNAPYKAALTHGFTVDEEGRKMSKSIGNTIAPDKVCNDLGADILRLWVASSDYSREISVSDEILKRSADSYRRIRNTARYLLSNLNDFDPTTDAVAADEMVALDRWAVDRAARLQQELIEDYDNYQFHLIYQKLHNFCVTDLGGFYLDIIKDRVYTVKADALPRRSAQTAVYHIAEALVRWIAPILSFTADEIWKFMPGERGASVQLAEWYQGLTELNADDAMGRAYWDDVMAVKTAVNKVLEAARVAGTIGSGLDAEVTLHCDAELAGKLEQLKDELRFVLITSQADIVVGDSEGETTDLDGLRVEIKVSQAAKCGRCWHLRDDVGSDDAHPELCARCVTNVDGAGESRAFA